MIALPTPSTHAQLRTELSDRDIQRLVATKQLFRVRRGFYLPTLTWTSLSSTAQAQVRVIATARHLGPGAVISHTSAALLHGLPTGTLQLDRSHATWPGSPGRGPTTSVVPHRSIVAKTDMVSLGDVTLTSVARTLYDIATCAEIGLAVAMADHALRQTRVTPLELATVLVDKAGRRGARRARQVLEFADGRAESVGESIIRVRLRQLGLPTPELQAPIRDHAGNLIARVDFLFTELRTVIEFDGKVKYEALLRPGESAADVVCREKLREDAIRSRGYDVVRLVWNDRNESAKVLASCLAAFERQGHGRWTPGVPGLLARPARLR